MEPNHHGRTHISLEHSQAQNLALQPEAISRTRKPRFAAFFAVWMRMRPSTRDIFAYWLANPHLCQSDLARKFRITPQAMHHRVALAARKSPELRVFIRARRRAKTLQTGH